jgi:hypothetical protein
VVCWSRGRRSKWNAQRHTFQQRALPSDSVIGCLSIGTIEAARPATEEI